MDPSSLLAAAKSGGASGVMDYFRQPVAVLRIVAVLFAIIVFGCVSSGCHTLHNPHYCIFNGEPLACSYAVAIGVFAFLLAIGFTISDLMFNSVSNVKKRRYIVVGDLGCSGLWAFLWFVGFCLLTNKWTNTHEDWLVKEKVQGWQENNARAAIVFSLASTAVWAGITFFALQRFRLGQSGLGSDESAGMDPSLAPGADAGGMVGSGYAGIPDQPPQQSYGGDTNPASGGAPGSYYTPTY
ncbi:putative synaptic vesicle protein synaptogyrin involved in regulation of ca2+-dependent exocytosis [Fasciola hepatica]|uniref:Synaptic vesicle protein synaptogyrin involved in regulation of ca2+-dependent exocytosis n=1 Tax=Fasciola hepatica TaxID=6192 RepID=A0A4E0RYE9_FASHE|nr:putative synaptic vesicle protein synaptogyrin involved in regulation of ca2+-dependent exocytosis [Fasciola hepatica]